MSKYPSEIDSDAELPRIEDNVSEIGAEALNAMREAIIALEEAVGVNPQGAAADLVTRLSSSLNEDGTLKASALVAAGLIALPVTNSMIGASAAVEESKLDLDVATQTLQDQITSNDVDIAALQDAIAELINKFNKHIAGTEYRHDTSHIDLATALTSIVASDLDTALVAMNNRYLDHVDGAKVGAHMATNVSVDTSGFEVIQPASINVQLALGDLDAARERLFEIHRDEMHANGINHWANDRDGYSIYNKKFPGDLDSGLGFVASGTRNVFEFDGYALAGLNITQGDILIIPAGSLSGSYIINDVGPRPSVGSKPALQSDQFEITGVFADGYATQLFSAFVYAQSSLYNLKGSVSPSIYQSDVGVDSVVCSRPNAARITSLGIDPRFVDSSYTLDIEAGVGDGLSRTISIDNLHYDRLGGPASTVTIDTIIERINYVLQNRTDGNAFPATAYRVGDELMLSHNWIGNDEIFLRVLSSGTGNYILGMDGYGANVVDQYSYPRQSSYFYVNGQKYTDFKSILSTTADVASQTFTFSGVNPLTAGVKPGHLIHVKSHSVTAERGTYFITSVTANTVVVSKTAGLTTENGVEVEIVYDAAALDEFNSAVENKIIETYLTSTGSMGYNERLSYTDNINNLKIVDVSDNFLESEYTLVSSISGGTASLQLDDGKETIVPTTFTGKTKVYSPTNIEYVEVEITAPVGAGSNDLTIYEHINEEELFEVCTVHMDGSLTVSAVKDRRMFGSTGIDEIREDYTQAYIETPLSELRANGIVRGFDILRDSGGGILSDGYIEPSLFPNNQGIAFRGGVVYVDGVRCDIPTTPVMFPNTAGTYIVALNTIGKFEVFDTSDYSLEEVLDGYAGEYTPLAEVTHNGSDIISAEDRRFFIDKIDDKVELILDLTNRMTGHFATFEAARGWINSYPFKEKCSLRIVSDRREDVTIDGLNRELSIILDGRLGDVVVNSPVKISGCGLPSREDAHIDGQLILQAGASEFVASGIKIGVVDILAGANNKAKFENCLFDGYIGGNSEFLVSGSVDKVEIKDCVFSNNADAVSFSASVNNLLLENTSFTSSVSREMVILASSAIVSGCTFDGVGLQNLSTGNAFKLNHCDFRNLTTSATINVLNTDAVAIISDNVFSGITTSGNAETAIRVIGDGSVMSNCVFDTCVVLNNDALLALDGTVSNCTFEAVTFPTNQSITVDTFVGNRLQNAGSLTALVGCVEFKDNIDWHGVTEKNGSTSIRSIVGNRFLNNTLAYNVDMTGAAAADEIIIANNIFDTSGATIMDAIVAGNAASILSIAGNQFTGDNTDTAIDFRSNTGSAVVTGNTFKIIDGFASASALSNIVIKGNTFESSDLTLVVGSGCVFSENISQSSVHVIQNGSGTDNLIVTNNVYDSSSSLSLDMVSLTDSLVTTNTFDGYVNFNNSGSLSGVNVSQNIGYIQFEAGTSFDNVIMSQNSMYFVGLDNIEWRNSFISNNTFRNVSGQFTFNLYSTGGDNANVLIQENIFNVSDGVSSAITIDSANPVRGFYFSENVNNGGVATLDFGSQINEAVINENSSFGISLTNGGNSTIISGNMMLNEDIILENACSSLIINSNYLRDVFVNCSGSGIDIINNIITSDLNVFSVSGTRAISPLRVVSNSVTGNIEFGSGVNAGDVLSVTNVLLSANRAGGDISIFPVAVSGAAYSASDFKISGNDAANVKVLGDLGVYDTVGAERIVLSTNNISGDITFNAGDTNRVLFRDCSILQNQADFILINSGVGCDGVSIQANSVNSIGVQLEARSSITDFKNISIIGNIISNTFSIEAGNATGVQQDVEISQLDITGNLFSGRTLTFTNGMSVSGDTCIFTGMRISSNIAGGIFWVLSNANAHSEFFGCGISGNIFDGAGGGISLVCGSGITSVLSMCAIDNNVSSSSDVDGLGNPSPPQKIVLSGNLEVKGRCSISGNSGLGIEFNVGVGESMDIQGRISGNMLSNQDIKRVGVDGLLFFADVEIASNNIYNGDISLTYMGLVANCAIQNNTFEGTGGIDFSNNSSGFRNNIFSSNNIVNGYITFDLSSTLSDITIIGNQVRDLLLTNLNSANRVIISSNKVFRDLSLSSVSLIEFLHMIGNNVFSEVGAPAVQRGTITLPDNAAFTSSAQSTIAFNFAYTWVSDGVINTNTVGQNEIIFPWGNTTITVPTGVNFLGGGGGSVGGANGVNGIAPGPISCT